MLTDFLDKGTPTVPGQEDAASKELEKFRTYCQMLGKKANQLTKLELEMFYCGYLPTDIFNEEMSSSEARITLFKAIEGKTADEIEQIFAEYSTVIPAILEREHRLADEGWCID